MEREEIEIDLREVFLYLLSNALIIILSTIAGALAMYLTSSVLMDKKFESSTKIYVLNQQDNQSVTYTDLQTGTQLTKDYAVLVKSRTVTTQVIAELNLQNKYKDMEDITSDDLEEMITVTTAQDTRIITITVRDTNPTRAQDIANAVRAAASKHIYEVMDIEAVNVVDYANLPEKPVSPNVLKTTILGAIAALFLVVVILVVSFLLDDTIKTPDDVEMHLGLSVLASIPYDDTMEDNLGKKKKKRKTSMPIYSNRPTLDNSSIPVINLDDGV
ncbi:MAG: protein-tyrosine kinase [Lachnospiraceae bacterium]|nr:protein-tyrosine kinase [Lachnospiraceae bacterium]